MHIPSFKLISQSTLKKSPENSDGRTDGRTDGQTDGHCHSIIRPFFKRAYNKKMLVFKSVFWWLITLQYKNKMQPQVYASPKKTITTRTPAFWRYPPPPHDYPYHGVMLDPKSKEDKVKVTNLKNTPKLQIFEFWNKCYMWHTFWGCLIRCANMKWIRQVLLKIQSGHDSVHRRTDGQTDEVKPVYPPFNFVEAGGIKIHHRTG